MEVVRGQVGSQRAWGYYADLFYHFPYAERVTGILRYETFDPDTRLSGDKRRRWVMGAKYLLPPGLTISLNYVREPSAPAGQRSAAQLQIFQTFHFGGG